MGVEAVVGQGAAVRGAGPRPRPAGTGLRSARLATRSGPGSGSGLLREDQQHVRLLPVAGGGCRRRALGDPLARAAQALADDERALPAGQLRRDLRGPPPPPPAAPPPPAPPPPTHPPPP